MYGDVPILIPRRGDDEKRVLQVRSVPGQREEGGPGVVGRLRRRERERAVRRDMRVELDRGARQRRGTGAVGFFDTARDDVEADRPCRRRFGWRARRRGAAARGRHRCEHKTDASETEPHVALLSSYRAAEHH